MISICLHISFLCYIYQECCNSLYGNEFFASNAESIPGTSTEAYSEAAKQNNVYVVAGQNKI